MRNIFLTFTILIGFSTAHATGFQPGNLDLVEYLDEGSGNCSGYFADLSLAGDNSDVRLIYAHHCDIENGNDVTESGTFFTRAKTRGASNLFDNDGESGPASFSAQFSLASPSALIGTDVIARKGQDLHSLPSYLSRHLTSILKPAKIPPAIGETLIAEGYPQAVGPKASQCKYLGVFIDGETYNSPSGMHAVFSAFGSVICETDGSANTMAGMSGGPLLNQKGEVVGTITAGSMLESGDSHGKLLMLFSALNRQSLTGDTTSPVHFPQNESLELDHVISAFTTDGVGMHSTANGTVWACFDKNGNIAGTLVEHDTDKSLKVTPTLVTKDGGSWSFQLENGDANKFTSSDVTCHR